MLVDLHLHASNVYSQGGEDGILNRLLEELGIDQGRFCEFGAWDGRNYSNTYALHERGWSGIYIEGDPGRFRDLQKNILNSDTEAVLAWVSGEGEFSLDAILSRSALIRRSAELTVLSIDIDSDDLHIWRSLNSVRPTIVLIEYNPTIPVDILYENPKGENKGNSCRSIFMFAEQIGYELVAATPTNLIFVEKSKLPSSVKVFKITDLELKTGNRFFFGFDGALLFAQTGNVSQTKEQEIIGIPWKRAWMVQPVPKIFRRYAQGPIAEAAFSTLSILRIAITHPLTLVGRLLNR